jgi:hypothetical protein
MIEPIFGCPKCSKVYTLDECVRRGGACSQCSVALVMHDSASASAPLNPSWPHPKQPPVTLAGSEPYKVAVVHLPSRSEVDRDAAQQFISSLSLPVSLEYFGKGEQRSLLVRGPASVIQVLVEQLPSVWPRASLTILENDPVAEEKSGQVSNKVQYGYWLTLAQPPYLPLKVFQTFLKGDPVNAILAAMTGLVGDESVWIQVLLRSRGNPEWLADILKRLKVEAQRGYIVDPAASVASTPVVMQPAMSYQANLPRVFMGIVFLSILACAALFVVLDYLWLAVLIAALAVVAVVVISKVIDVQDPWQLADLSLVRQKVVQDDHLIQAAVRIFVSANSQERAQLLLKQLYSTLAQYNLAGGNGFAVLRDDRGAAVMPRFDVDDVWIWLGADEVSGLWHPPVIAGSIAPSRVAVQELQLRSPSPGDVSGISTVGYARGAAGNGHDLPVKISLPALRKGIFLIGKPGTGKTTFMKHLVKAAACDDPDRPAIVVVDPHGDLADELRGLLPQNEAGRIRIMDFGDPEYALTFNPLDVYQEHMDAVMVTRAIIDVGSSLWGQYWGPRMQIPLARGVLALAAINANRSPSDLLGLSLLPSLMEVGANVRNSFLEEELGNSRHAEILRLYFSTSYQKMSPNFREQVISPVLSKAFRFQEEPMLYIFSAPASRLKIAEVLRERQILILNTRRSDLGDELSSFLGALMVNLIVKQMELQGRRGSKARAPVMVVIDEFQQIEGVDWSALLGQMRKFGARVCLGTQSLASLREKFGLDIPGVILGGVHTLISFAVNGDDAAWLAEKEFGYGEGGPSPTTLANLPEFFAYVRTINEQNNSVPPFAMKTAPPPVEDADLADWVWENRKTYSVPVDIARQQAVEKMRLMTVGYDIVSLGTTAQPQAPGEAAQPNAMAEIMLGRAPAAAQGTQTPGTGSVQLEFDKVLPEGLEEELNDLMNFDLEGDDIDE